MIVIGDPARDSFSVDPSVEREHLAAGCEGRRAISPQYPHAAQREAAEPIGVFRREHMLRLPLPAPFVSTMADGICTVGTPEHVVFDAQIDSTT